MSEQQPYSGIPYTGTGIGTIDIVMIKYWFSGTSSTPWRPEPGLMAEARNIPV